MQYRSDRNGSPISLLGFGCALSGMNSITMVEEDCRVADTAHAGDLTQEDFDLVARVKDAINERVKIGCTGCGYCVPCPQALPIREALEQADRELRPPRYKVAGAVARRFFLD